MTLFSNDGYFLKVFVSWITGPSIFLMIFYFYLSLGILRPVILGFLTSTAQQIKKSKRLSAVHISLILKHLRLRLWIVTAGTWFLENNSMTGCGSINRLVLSSFKQMSPAVYPFLYWRIC